MAKPRPKKRRERKAAGQLPLPTPRPLAAIATRVLPMQLQVGDRLTDEEGEWEIATTAGLRSACVPEL